MMKQGLLNEVKSVKQYKNKNALKTVGYTELFDFLTGKIELTEAIEKIKVNTRRYYSVYRKSKIISYYLFHNS